MEVVNLVIRTHTTGTVTCTATTDSASLPDVTGHVKCIVIKPSGTSTNIAISATKAGVTETIFGATPVAVAATGIAITPQKLAVDVDNGALTVTSNTYVDFILDHHDLTIAVTNCANAETYVVEIIVEE